MPGLICGNAKSSKNDGGIAILINNVLSKNVRYSIRKMVFLSLQISCFIKNLFQLLMYSVCDLLVSDIFNFLSRISITSIPRIELVVVEQKKIIWMH
jgi:hypothetical protein